MRTIPRRAPEARAARALKSLATVLLLTLAAAAATASERLTHRYLEVSLSPDGARVASVEGDSPTGNSPPDVRELVIRTTDGGAATPVPLPCGHLPQCWPASLAWTPDGDRLTFALRSPGSHDYSLYDVQADGSGLRLLLAFKGTLTHLEYSPEGTLAVLAIANARKEVGATQAGAALSGDLDAAPEEQRIATLAHGALHWASPPELFVYQFDWRPHGAGFIGTAARGAGDNNWWTARLYAFAAEDGSARVLYAPASARQQIAAPTVSPDGRTVAFIAGLMSDFGSTGGDVYALPLDTGPALDLTPGIKASASALAWDCDGHLRVQALAGDRWQILDAGSGRAPVIPKVLWSGAEGLHGSGSAPACPSGSQALVHESFTVPPEIEVGRPGEWRDLTRLNSGLTLTARVQSVSWTNDGFTEQGWLLLPATGTGKFPLVTMVHGGPASAATPRFPGPGLVSKMLARGWAVFQPNPRGSFGQGERFTTANVRDFGHGDLRDILSGIDAAERVAPIDESRLGIEGGSYGGFMTMWAVTQTHRFKAAVAAAGVSDWLSYYGENGIDEWMIPYFGASVYEDPAVYARSSPINFIRQVRTPTFEYVGERDIECPAPQTQEFWHALKTLGVPTSVMIYPGEGHGLRDPAHARDAMERTLAWFDAHLR